MDRLVLVVERRDPRERDPSELSFRGFSKKGRGAHTCPALSSFIGDDVPKKSTASRLFPSFLFSAILIYINNNNNNSRDYRGPGEIGWEGAFESRTRFAPLYVFVQRPYFRPEKRFLITIRRSSVISLRENHRDCSSLPYLLPGVTLLIISANHLADDGSLPRGEAVASWVQQPRIIVGTFHASEETQGLAWQLPGRQRTGIGQRAIG